MVKLLVDSVAWKHKNVNQLHIQPLSQTANGAKTGDQMENYKNRLRNIIKTENTNSSINELKSDFENDLDDYVEIKVERP
ncbi:unnamed protein product, partial [Diamesa serratosioi]